VAGVNPPLPSGNSCLIGELSAPCVWLT
jgi:hypothetical protein